MSTTAFLKSDLSLIRLVAEGVDSTWKAPAIPEDGEDSARPLLQRADEGAAWLTAQPAVRRRLSAAVIDVDEALCAWVKAPSDARPVLCAALRSLMQEWGDERLADSVEPLAEEAPSEHTADRSPLIRMLRRVRERSAPGESRTEEPEPQHRGVALAVIALPDALVRLWLDALDRRNIRAGRVMTLWHALASAWNRAPADVISGVLLVDEGRLAWAWARESALLAGGSVELDRPRARPEEGPNAPLSEADPRPGACKRLALDWLTWSSQLALTPDRIVIVGPDCRAWAEALAEHWAPIDAECVEQREPLAATLGRLAAAAPDLSPPSSRRCLEVLTRRPTRALRARYRLAGAAMILLLVAVSSVAFRLRQKANEWRDEAGSIREESIELVRDGFPSLASARITVPDKVAQTEIQKLIEEEPIDLPPVPRQIPEEMARVVSILADPTFDGQVRLERISLDQLPNGNQLQYTAPDRQVAAEILRRLNDPERMIGWEARGGLARGDPLHPSLQGDWILK